MDTEYFVDKDSIVREIWGKSDTILFIFAGAAAEFALNKAVDWLYFTGRLPADPLGRLFSTVAYARAIVFSEKEAAHKAIDTIAAIHASVEEKRGMAIPDWAYRDVLFMLIDYSMRSYELLERKLTRQEKQEAFDVFYRVGSRMGVKGLPHTLDEWEEMRAGHLHNNLEYGPYTGNLFLQYRKHLGMVRYTLMLQTQAMLAPQRVCELLRLPKKRAVYALPWLYKSGRQLSVMQFLKRMLLPAAYKKEILALDRQNKTK